MKDNDKYQARINRGEKYAELLKKVYLLYNETSCTTSQIAHRCNISPTKVCHMLAGRYPQYYKDYLNAPL